MSLVAETSGVRTAIARLDDAKRTLSVTGMRGRLLHFTCGLLKQKALAGISKLHGGTCGRPIHCYLRSMTCGLEAISQLTGLPFITTRERYLTHISGLKQQSDELTNRAIGRHGEQRT